MHTIGLLLRARLEHAAAVSVSISQLAGAEVHTADDHGRIVVTVERTVDADLLEAHGQMMNIPGVLSSALVYHFFDADDKEEL